jgi:hypothetical protein
MPDIFYGALVGQFGINHHNKTSFFAYSKVIRFTSVKLVQLPK